MSSRVSDTPIKDYRTALLSASTVAMISSVHHFVRALVEMLNGVLSSISDILHWPIRISVEALNVVLDIFLFVIEFMIGEFLSGCRARHQSMLTRERKTTYL